MWESLANRYSFNQNGAFYSGEAYRVRRVSDREHREGPTAPNVAEAGQVTG